MFWLIISLIIACELLIILKLSAGAIIIILLVHIVFFAGGYWLLRKYDFKELAFFDAIRLKKEPLTIEFIELNLSHLAVIMLILPSILSHIIGLALFTPNFKKWLIQQLYNQSV